MAVDDPEDDLSNRDLSQVPESELTSEERKELKRRLDAFVKAVREKLLGGTDPTAGPKQGGK